MVIRGIKFKRHRCFKNHWSGFDQFSPITLIIGKNNSGKSHLLELVETLSKGTLNSIRGLDIKTTTRLDTEALKRQFQENTSGGDLPGNHWSNNGILYEGATVGWERSSEKNQISVLEGGRLSADRYQEQESYQKARNKRIVNVLGQAKAPICGRSFRRLLADRDIQPEQSSNALPLAPNGDGATNIVRRFLNSANPSFPEDLVRSKMLDALNRIFGEDGFFQEISVKQIDGDDPERAEDVWEIYLLQEHKGSVALSDSGSSLKTIFLVLLNLLVIPHIEQKKLSDYIFAFEELENNLHPSLLRRLLSYLESFAPSAEEDAFPNQPTFFLTTHSNVALDYFAGRDHAQIIHVSHDGKSGWTQTIVQSSKQLEVIRDLGSRASDLLQANGIIWVEGPSDRVYLNRWIDLYSEGEFEEGRHYQCMFYGGGLLANLGVTFDEEKTDELINLLKINPNTIVISDSDRARKGAHLKERVKRIRSEFETLDQNHAFHWILEAREIENYLTANLARWAASKTSASASDPGQYESFFPKVSESSSYLEDKMKRKSFDKTELALITAPQMTMETMSARFDLDISMKKIISLIKNWNK